MGNLSNSGDSAQRPCHCRPLCVPRLVLAALLVSSWPSLLRAQSVVTVAGGGTDDGRPATAASLSYPFDVALDSSGNLFIADYVNRVVRRVDAKTSRISVVAGNGSRLSSPDGTSATASGITAPAATAIDADGSIYVSDQAGHKVRRVDPVSGLLGTVAGTGDSGSSGDGGPATRAALNEPTGLVLDGARRILYLADRGNHRVRAVDLQTGLVRTVAGTGGEGFSGDGGPATSARLSRPHGVSLDGEGNLLIADFGNGVVRRVSRVSGVISTLAGNGQPGFSGDGGPATLASMSGVYACVLDAAGNLYAADFRNNRIRRVEASTGKITTFAGDGRAEFAGDGGPATGASLNHPAGLAIGKNGDLFVADSWNHRVRRMNLTTSAISTYAGPPAAGTATNGDGGPALNAFLHAPMGVALESSGTLVFSEHEEHRLRRLKSDGTIETIAGRGFAGEKFSEDAGNGGPGTSGLLNGPAGVAVSASGDILFVERGWHTVRRLSAGTGQLSTVAGTGSPATGGNDGDGGPATAARLNSPMSVAIDSAGGIYVSDTCNKRIRRVAPGGTITTVAGGGSGGDGGLAIEARLDTPAGIALDQSDGLLVAEQWGHRIRRIDLKTGLIDTIAGTGEAGSSPDGTLARQAKFEELTWVAVDAKGTIVFSEATAHRIRRINGEGKLETVAGTGAGDFSGDGGAATAATMDAPYALVFDSRDRLFFADVNTNRIRVISGCGPVAAPALLSPSQDASGTPLQPILRWEAVRGAERYDVYLGTDEADLTLVARDLPGTSLSPANLLPGRRYSWRVSAKSDPFCVAPSSATSTTGIFTTILGCEAPPAPQLLSPASGALDVADGVALQWSAVAGAGSYDVYLGTGETPPLVAPGIIGTSYVPQGLPPGSRIFWNVVARAACDPSRASTSAPGSFQRSGTCSQPASFSLTGPASGASNVEVAPLLSWSPAAGAGSYDVYFGTASAADPPLYAAGLSPATSSLKVSALTPAETYSWKVVARAGCESGGVRETPVSTFTVEAACRAPGVPVVDLVPSRVTASRSYVVTWKPPDGLDAGAGYIVERSRDPDFGSVLDRQFISGPSAAFRADGPGDLFVRVQAVAGCDPAVRGPASAPVRTVVTSATQKVIVTRQPQPVFTEIGENFEEPFSGRRTSFTVENVGGTAATLSLKRQFLENSSREDFFYFRDPAGGSTETFTLESGASRTFEIRFRGVARDREGSYQGVVEVAPAGDLSAPGSSPLVYVNLKVGGADASVPEFRRDGRRVEAVTFPGLTGDDSGRSPISVDIYNPGASPMELAAEIGPELWLEPQAGWNAQPIAPGASRTVNLLTRRTRAPDGTALPRYTYFTVRTKGGASARLLVQDNDAPILGSGRPLLARGQVSYIVPSAASALSARQNLFVSRLTLSNSGTETVQAEIYRTPPGADGAVVYEKASVIAPPGDVVALTDPLVQLFGLSRPAVGSLEVRVPEGKAGFLTVTSGVDAPARTGGVFGFQMPVVLRGTGAKLGKPSEISGITASADYRTNLILTETSGLEAVEVKVTLFDRDAVPLGDAEITVGRYGMAQINNVVAALGGGEVREAASVEIEVTSGGGAVFAVATVIDNRNDDAVTYVSRSMEPEARPLSRRLVRRPLWARGTETFKYVVPSIVSGYTQLLPGTGTAYMFRSLMGFKAPASQRVTFSLTYYDLAADPANPRIREATVVVDPRKQKTYQNVAVELFGAGPGEASQGPVFVEVTGAGSMYTKVFSTVEGSGSFGDSFPVIPITTEGLTGGGFRTPLEIDGLEQAFVETSPGVWTERGRGTRSNLILNEVGGLPATVRVSLYEPGDRLVPIAEKEFDLKPLERLQLNTVFAALGLNDEAHRKDRTNVKCVIQSVGGDGLVSAVVTTIDNQTADTRNGLPTPTGGGGTGPIGF